MLHNGGKGLFAFPCQIPIGVPELLHYVYLGLGFGENVLHRIGKTIDVFRNLNKDVLCTSLPYDSEYPHRESCRLVFSEP